MRAKRDRRQKRRQWTDEERREILRELDESGMTVREFGDAIGVNWSLLYEWRRRYAEERDVRPGRARGRRGRSKSVARGTARSNSAFARVVIVDDESDAKPSGGGSGGIELRHRSGWSIVVDAGFDEEALGRVLSVVTSRC